MKLKHAGLVVGSVLCLFSGFAMAEQFSSHALADGPPRPLAAFSAGLLVAPGTPSPAPDFWTDAFGRHFKVDERHLVLTQDSSRTAATVLLRGGLELATDGALGADYNRLTMVHGTSLVLRDGVTMRQTVEVLPGDPVGLLPPGLPLSPVSGPGWATLRVDQGEAHLGGMMTLHAPVVKEGAGTLHLTEFNQSVTGDAFTVQSGGLRMDGLWLGGAIRTGPGTVLSGTGFIQEARVAGHLLPGSPDAVGTLMFDQHLELGPSARTRIRIDTSGQTDQLFSWGTMHLDGDLWVEAQPGDWTPQTRWTIAEAQGGFEAAPATSLALRAGPAAVPASSGGSGFARVQSNLRYLSPVLTYLPTTLVLGLAYNRHGLNRIDGLWRSALVEDSRFVRESALTHAQAEGAWVQSWGFNAQRPADDDLPGDDRDIAGLQLGVTRSLAGDGSRGSPWRLSAFVGTQSTDLSSRYDPEVRHGARDLGVHAGLGVSGRVAANLRLAAGVAHAWHSARLWRKADPGEAPLRTRSRAQLTQGWLEARSDQPVPVGDWGWTPYARVAWLQLSRAAASEAGSLAAVTLDPRREQRWVSHVGMQWQRHFDTAHGPARLIADLGVQSHGGPRGLESSQSYCADPGQTWRVSSPPGSRHAVNLNLGVDAPVARNARLTLAYGGQYAPRQVQHGVWLGVSIAV
ncbi:MAG TPA: autotransporter outer membrane beta-barrel domain-containing protein [Castellaniella sp.]|uniref:autotransporter outer membrane beta-barrel domain-containing protein n=1 Tax=Castellaniella sp. TaxID=1955812 RepID=UPI002EEDB6CF